MFRVPLPIPDLILETIPDEAGYTDGEKLALRNAWGLITPRMEQIAKEIFIEFFSENETLINGFRNKDGIIDMDEFHMHPYNIFYLLTRMIYTGLKSAADMHSFISPVACSHWKGGIDLEKVELLTSYLNAVLKKDLKRMLSPTLESGINKICEVILNAHTYLKD